MIIESKLEKLEGRLKIGKTRGAQTWSFLGVGNIPYNPQLSANWKKKQSANIN